MTDIFNPAAVPAEIIARRSLCSKGSPPVKRTKWTPTPRATGRRRSNSSKVNRKRSLDKAYWHMKQSALQASRIRMNRYRFLGFRSMEITASRSIERRQEDRHPGRLTYSDRLMTPPSGPPPLLHIFLLYHAPPVKTRRQRSFSNPAGPAGEPQRGSGRMRRPRGGIVGTALDAERPRTGGGPRIGGVIHWGSWSSSSFRPRPEEVWAVARKRGNLAV